MADNYLEKRMEEYRSGRLATLNRSTSAMRAPKRENALIIKYPPMIVMIMADVISPVVEETVKAFCAVGCRVAFTVADNVGGNALAQRSGARFYPGRYILPEIIDDMAVRWGDRPEVMVSFCDDVVTGVQGDGCEAARFVKAKPFEALSSEPKVIARHILYISHPDNEFLLG